MIAALMLAVVLGIDPQGRAAAPPAVPQEVPRTPPATELRVVLATPVYEPNGSVGVETTMVENGGTSILHLFARKSVCEVAKSSKDEPKDASVGWRVTTHTISQTPTEIVVSVDWRRMWDRGKKISDGPAATQQLVLHPGDSIPLDHIPNLQASGDCRAVGLGLEVRIARVTVQQPSVQPANDALPLGAQPGGTAALAADLWLVHKKPSGVPEVLHQTVRLPTTGGPFAFSTVKFPTANGEIGVELTGTFRRFQTPTGEYVFMSMTRVITGGSAPSGGLSQSTAQPLALPGPTEVLSFEMPSGGGGARGGAGAGGREQMISGGVAAGGVGGVVMSPRSVAGSGGATAQAGGGTGGGGVATGGQRGGGGGGGTGTARGGGGGGRGGAIGSPVATSQRMTALAAAILDGHEFSLRIQLKPVAQ